LLFFVWSLCPRSFAVYLWPMRRLENAVDWRNSMRAWSAH